MLVSAVRIRETHQLGLRTRERVVSRSQCPELDAHGIALTGRTEAAADYCFIRLQPVRSHVVASLSGMGEAWCQGRWVALPAGSVYLTPVGLPHGFRTRGKGPWRLCWVSYGGPTISVREPQVLSHSGGPLEHAIAGLDQESHGSGERAFLRRWTELVASESQRMARPLVGIRSRLAEVWQAVDDDPGHAWTMGELAEIAGVGPEQLRRLSLQEEGITPMRRVLELRMRRAGGLLAHAHISLDEIARQVGFASAFSFSTAFRRIFGLPPQRYRLSLAEGSVLPPIGRTPDQRREAGGR